MNDDGAAPFDLAGDDRGVLLVHGFTGTPFEMSYLGRSLHQRGMTVVCPVLPGHGAHPSDLHHTSWEDWFREVETKFDELKRRCRKVAVAGLSLGGLLSLHLAATRGAHLAAIASMGAPLWLGPLPRLVIGQLRRSARLAGKPLALPKLGGPDVRDPAMRRAIPSYPVFPARGLVELDRVIATVRAELPQVTAPLLVVHGRRDHTAPYACSTELIRRVGSQVVRRRPLPASYHLVTLDVEREICAAEVGAFFEPRLR